MSNYERLFEIQRSMNRFLNVYNNPAIQFANQVNQHSSISQKVFRFSNAQMLDNPMIRQIQQQHKILEKVMSTHQALYMPINEMSQIISSVATLPSFHRIAVHEHAWNSLQHQLIRVTQLPEWPTLRDNIEPKVKLDELLETLSQSSTKNIEPKQTHKRRKRMIAKAQERSKSLSVGDYCSIASLLISIYQVIVDESVKNQIGILLNKWFMSLIR